MRQAGIIAAGGLYALKNNIQRLKEDHNHAQALGSTLLDLDWVKDVVPVDTNIVVAILHDDDKRDAIINKIGEKDVKTMAFGLGMIRFVTHLDVTSAQIDETIGILKSI